MINPCCCSNVPLDSAQIKSVTGLAWWPGWLPLTLDGTTINTTKFQTAPHTPYSFTKYTTYYYTSRSEQISESSPAINIYSWMELKMEFDPVYGDLVSAEYSSRSTTFAYGTVTEHWEWNVGSGIRYVNSDVYTQPASYHPMGYTPSTVPWVYMDGSDVMLPCVAGTFWSTSRPAALKVLFGQSSASGTTSGSYYDFGNWTYTASAELQLGGAETLAMTTDRAIELMKLRRLTQPPPASSSISLTAADSNALVWNSPGSYTYTYFFDYNDAVLAETLLGNRATNFLIICYNRAVGVFTVGGSDGSMIMQADGRVVAIGIPNCYKGDEYQSGTRSRILNVDSPNGLFWEQPESDLGIMVKESLVFLEGGLSCSNTYYDFETLWPFDESIGDMVTPTVGVHDIAAGEWLFTPIPLEHPQTEPPCMMRLPSPYIFGDGWLKYFPGVHATRPTFC